MGWTQDHAPAGLARLPLRAHGADAGGVRGRGARSALRRAAHPRGVEPDRGAGAGLRRRLLGAACPRGGAVRRRGADLVEPGCAPVPGAGSGRGADRDGPADPGRRERRGVPAGAARRAPGSRDVRDLPGPGVRVRAAGGLAGVLRRYGRTPRTPAHLRLPARALLAGAGHRDGRRHRGRPGPRRSPGPRGRGAARGPRRVGVHRTRVHRHPALARGPPAVRHHRRPGRRTGRPGPRGGCPHRPPGPRRAGARGPAAAGGRCRTAAPGHRRSGRRRRPPRGGGPLARRVRRTAALLAPGGG